MEPAGLADQAEAYAAAKVRQALEQAAAIVQTAADESDQITRRLALTAYADDIRALIKEQS